MGLSLFLIAFALQGGAQGSAQGATLPMPQKTDVPNDLSTVICPNEAAARRMLNDFYSVKPAPNNYNTNGDAFFAGLRATGCRQDSPHSNVPITIRSVLARKTVKLARESETYMLYRGVNAKGVAVVGIVNETVNNKHPRTDYERWLATWAPDGRLEVSAEQGSDPVYLCPSVTAARLTVRAIPVKGNGQAKNTAFANARKANGCRRAAPGVYRVTARYEHREILCGYECSDDWNALAATDPRGRAVALIFDGSHF